MRLRVDRADPGRLRRVGTRASRRRSRRPTRSSSTDTLQAQVRLHDLPHDPGRLEGRGRPEPHALASRTTFAGAIYDLNYDNLWHWVLGRAEPQAELVPGAAAARSVQGRHAVVQELGRYDAEPGAGDRQVPADAEVMMLARSIRSRESAHDHRRRRAGRRRNQAGSPAAAAAARDAPVSSAGSRPSTTRRSASSTASTALLFFVIGGIEALLIRVQLWGPNGTVLTANQYNQIFTMHGTTMVFLMGMPLVDRVRQLPRPADDRRARRRVPAHQHVRLLGVPARRRCSSTRASCSAARRTAVGSATRRSRARRCRRASCPATVPTSGPIGLIMLGIGSVTSAVNFIVTVDQHARAGHDVLPDAGVRLDDDWSSRSSRCSRCRSSPRR